jgi:hypothetical protein
LTSSGALTRPIARQNPTSRLVPEAARKFRLLNIPRRTSGSVTRDSISRKNKNATAANTRK